MKRIRVQDPITDNLRAIPCRRPFNALAFAACALAISLSLGACKKDKETAEPFPVFGRCEPVAPKGGLSHTNPAGPYIFKTSGGGKIMINPGTQIILTHDDYPGFKIEFWGDADMGNGEVKISGNHENLNGLHIKDREGTRRTIVFPDGAKITMVTNELYGPLQSISIYDGAQVHRINPTCNTLEYSAINADMAKRLDDAEPDGETSSFGSRPRVYYSSPFTRKIHLAIRFITAYHLGKSIAICPLMSRIIMMIPASVIPDREA